MFRSDSSSSETTDTESGSEMSLFSESSADRIRRVRMLHYFWLIDFMPAQGSSVSTESTNLVAINPIGPVNVLSEEDDDVVFDDHESRSVTPREAEIIDVSLPRSKSDTDLLFDEDGCHIHDMSMKL